MITDSGSFERPQRRHSRSSVSSKRRRLAMPVSPSMKDSWRRMSACRFSSRWLRTRARTMGALIGLVMKSMAPTSSPRVSSSTSPRAEMKMTGMSQVAGLSLMRRHTSYPSMPGIMMSSRTRSGWRACTRSSALAPSVAK